MPIGPSLAALLLLLLVAALPLWPWSRGWSNRPTLLLGVLFTFVVVLWAVQLL